MTIDNGGATASDGSVENCAGDDVGTSVSTISHGTRSVWFTVCIIIFLGALASASFIGLGVARPRPWTIKTKCLNAMPLKYPVKLKWPYPTISTRPPGLMVAVEVGPLIGLIFGNCTKLSPWVRPAARLYKHKGEHWRWPRFSSHGVLSQRVSCRTRDI